MRLIDQHQFTPASWPEPLQADEVQVWHFRDGRRGAAAARLAELLAAYHGCRPGELRLGRGPHGKPYLDRPGAIEFNLSHTDGALLVALGRAQPLGVDVEALGRPRARLELARRYFAAAEAAALAALDPARLPRAFLQLWSCKEAVLKALGLGLGFGLARVAFALDDDGRPNALNVIDASAGGAEEWHIVQLEPGPDHVGALAWRGPVRKLRAFRGE